ncbi:uncharacterized protein I303_107065 [Kwoniella dejecticola CBS 10117]|uniref:Uncharacterized protein n=1 Tax=Kwoniella dejecticola CBS 10117 TaxID=1296121 RepID=A0A1A5ZYM9_9TREE|nr:uncharacterized protein I303_06466 [Kwoniella dejecticola CBS 10117]OBR82908.1 hypothetical protein I303_06466 [Kwoniella dejecticola CBS 10117]
MSTTPQTSKYTEIAYLIYGIANVFTDPVDKHTTFDIVSVEPPFGDKSANELSRLMQARLRTARRYDLADEHEVDGSVYTKIYPAETRRAHAWSSLNDGVDKVHIDGLLADKIKSLADTATQGPTTPETITGVMIACHDSDDLHVRLHGMPQNLPSGYNRDEGYGEHSIPAAPSSHLSGYRSLGTGYAPSIGSEVSPGQSTPTSSAWNLPSTSTALRGLSLTTPIESGSATFKMKVSSKLERSGKLMVWSIKQLQTDDSGMDDDTRSATLLNKVLSDNMICLATTNNGEIFKVGNNPKRYALRVKSVTNVNDANNPSRWNDDGTHQSDYDYSVSEVMAESMLTKGSFAERDQTGTFYLHKRENKRTASDPGPENIVKTMTVDNFRNPPNYLGLPFQR